MNDKKDFEAALKGKKVPLLVLDQKWHRLFAIHGKTDEISATEKELDELLKLQGKYVLVEKDFQGFAELFAVVRHIAEYCCQHGR